MPMENLKRRLSFRKKKKDVKVPECSKPHQWQEDEKKVREGSCSFQVRVSQGLQHTHYNFYFIFVILNFNCLGVAMCDLVHTV